MVGRVQGRRHYSVQPFQLYLERHLFPGTFTGEDVPVSFALPRQPATELLHDPPRYWELEIAGGGVTTPIRFNLPVYARPGMNLSR